MTIDASSLVIIWSLDEEVHCGMSSISVMVKEDESFENALKRFRRQVQKAGIIKETKRHMRYEKPSVKRKRKAMVARKRRLRRIRRINHSS